MNKTHSARRSSRYHLSRERCDRHLCYSATLRHSHSVFAFLSPSNSPNRDKTSRSVHCIRIRGSGYNHHNGRGGRSEKEQMNMYTHAFKRLRLVPDWRVNTEHRRCVAGGRWATNALTSLRWMPRQITHPKDIVTNKLVVFVFVTQHPKISGTSRDRAGSAIEKFIHRAALLARTGISQSISLVSPDDIL